MFRTEEEFNAWSHSACLSYKAVQLIKQIRDSNPARRVRSTVKNVTGRYPSRKMERTIQFKAHRNQLPMIYELEHDPDVIEYWDQPPPIKLLYVTTKGKRRAIVHNADFFVIRSNCAEWTECHLEESLIRLGSRQPHRYQRSANGKWRCIPGEEYADGFSFHYRIGSSAEIDWIFQRNTLFLEDFLKGNTFEVPEEIVTYLHSLVSAKPGITLAEVLSIIQEHNIISDHIYLLIITDRLYVDLSTSVLAQPDKAYLYLNQQAAEMYGATIPSLFPSRKIHIPIKAGTQVNWDNKSWEVLNRGESQTWLRDESGTVIILKNVFLDNLIGNEQMEPLHDDDQDSGKSRILREMLGSASPQELAEANRRYSMLLNFQSANKAIDYKVHVRSLFRWQEQYRKAESLFNCGFVGLLPQTKLRGNRNRKLPEESIALAQEYIAKKYEDPRQPSRYATWAKLEKECARRGIIAPSYRTFCLYVRARPTHQKTVKRKGRKAGYQVEGFYWALEFTTPRHGDRPFEIAHIDHTELDLELICSQTGKNLGRPWLTLLVDAYSRRVLAFCLLYDPPSYRSCMLVLQECVRRYHRLPQTLVMDGGVEFSGVYFETLLARYECVQKIRPASKGRFGSVCERIFGSTTAAFIRMRPRNRNA
jgi:transposase InsO family protein